MTLNCHFQKVQYAIVMFLSAPKFKFWSTIKFWFHLYSVRKDLIILLRLVSTTRCKHISVFWNMNISLSTKAGVLICLLFASFGTSTTMHSGTQRRLVSVRKRRVRKSRSATEISTTRAPHPSTKAPSTTPSVSPSSSCSDSEDVAFYAGDNRKGKPLYKKCGWLEDKNDNIQEDLCSMDEGKNGKDPAKVVCPDTCGECP